MDAQGENTSVIDASANSPSAITCAQCGKPFDVDVQLPRMRCPHCRALGYPDRAGVNLLSLNWDCPACGETNDGLTNFCLFCGTGLTSRCLSCESPVYSAVCSRCGAHQARLLRYQMVEKKRAIWVPITQAHIQKQIAQRQQVEAGYHPDDLVTEWRDIGYETEQRRQSRQSKHRTKRQTLGRTRWGLLWIIAGLALLLRDTLGSAFRWLQGTIEYGEPITWLQDGRTWLQDWWTAFIPSLSRLQTLSPSDPEYAYLFATAIFGIALLPIFIYLIRRLAQHLFP